MIIKELLQQLEQNKVIHIKVKVIPKSQENKIVGWLGEEKNNNYQQTKIFSEENLKPERILKIRIAAPAIRGKANEELISYLSKILGRGKQKIQIKSGATSNLKIIQIEP